MKGGVPGAKIGDRFKDKTTGNIFILRMVVDNDMIVLEGENGLGRRLTGKGSLKPFYSIHIAYSSGS